MIMLELLTVTVFTVNSGNTYSPVEKPLNRAQPRINCSKGLFGLIRSQTLCRITY